MLAITGQNYCHLVREVLTNILVRHRQGCSHNYRHNIQKEQNLTFEIWTITNLLFILIYTPLPGFLLPEFWDASLILWVVRCKIIKHVKSNTLSYRHVHQSSVVLFFKWAWLSTALSQQQTLYDTLHGNTFEVNILLLEKKFMIVSISQLR